MIVNDSEFGFLLLVSGVAVPVTILALIDWWGRRKEERSKNQR
jgi:purine-cytosine permease-like protein